jgi:hypothetical protein
MKIYNVLFLNDKYYPYARLAAWSWCNAPYQGDIPSAQRRLGNFRGAGTRPQIGHMGPFQHAAVVLRAAKV